MQVGSREFLQEGLRFYSGRPLHERRDALHPRGERHAEARAGDDRGVAMRRRRSTYWT